MIPGSNLFSKAISVIAPQSVMWYPITGRTVGSSGKYLNAYDLPISISGSFQSVKRQMINHLGLDLNKTYKMFYSSDETFDVDRARAGDRFTVNGRMYDAIGSADWVFQDAWKSVMLVDVGVAVDWGDYVVDNDPASYPWVQTIDFKAGISTKIQVNNWTAVETFYAAIKATAQTSGAFVDVSATYGGSNYTSSIEFLSGLLVEFFDVSWPASYGGQVMLEITSPVDVTAIIELSKGTVPP